MKDMIEKLGMKKVVWKDAGRTKVVRGETVVEDFFVKITPIGQDTIWINREAIVVIKGSSDS